MTKSTQTDLNANTSFDILILGHVTQDLLGQEIDSGYRIGGTVSFAAITALRLGFQPAVITKAASDTDLSELPSEANFHVLPSPSTTTFANVYTEQGRIQYCYTPALPIKADDIPETLRHPKIVLLGPLVGEIGADVACLFDSQTLIAAVPQGWMRWWDETGRVYNKPWENAPEILSCLDVLILSQEDIDYDLTHLDLFLEYVPLVVMTEYRDGSTVYQRQDDGEIIVTKIPPRPAKEIDPTGAGDIFATAFLLRLQETGDPIQSARFANVTASIGVESLGVSGIPSREAVLAYLNSASSLSKFRRS